jgi:ATP-binding cassette subfamily A (ABC1) protein 1
MSYIHVVCAGMLVSGSLKCLGSSQHLKTRFGRGLQIDISTGAASLVAARSFMLSQFPTIQEIECYGATQQHSHKPHTQSTHPAHTHTTTRIEPLSTQHHDVLFGWFVFGCVCACAYACVLVCLFLCYVVCVCYLVYVCCLFCVGNNLKYRLPNDSSSASAYTLTQLFTLIEQNKANVGIAEYSIGQTTLESIFIMFGTTHTHTHTITLTLTLTLTQG